MEELELTLKTIAILGLLPDDIKNRVDQLRALSVMALGPVIAGAGLAEDEVIRPEDLAERTGSNGVHSTGLEIHEDGTGDVPATAGLVVIDVDAFELELGIAAVLAGVVDAVLVADYLPELGADLVAALAALNVEDFSHDYFLCLGSSFLLEMGSEVRLG